MASVASGRVQRCNWNGPMATNEDTGRGSRRHTERQLVVTGRISQAIPAMVHATLSEPKRLFYRDDG